MTEPQLNAAKTGQASCDIRLDNSGFFMMPKDGSIESFARERQTRANTKMTICLLTDEICPLFDRLPKTRYPPSNPEKKVSYVPSFPGS